MRVQLLAILFTLLGLAAAWTKEDYEIFDLVSALETTEGKGTTFYSLLGIDSGASQAAITKAYRKKSLEMHPDKNPGVKNIQDRFTKLGVVTAILRSPEGRERYNFFYKNGVPKWRGTGYYYARFRPTLTHTIGFIVFLSSLAHMLVMRLNYNKDKRRVEYFERSAIAAAGNTKDKASAGKRRKVKVPMVEGNEGAGVLELVVQDGNVYLPSEDGSQTPLSSLATPPVITSIWPARLLLSLTSTVISYLPPDLQDKIPPFLHPSSASLSSTAEDDLSDPESPADTPTPTPTSKKNRLSAIKKQERLQGGQKRTNGDTSEGTGTGTENDSEDDEAGDDTDVVGDAEGEKKKKKAGLGKAGGARRRKMAMKK